MTHAWVHHSADRSEKLQYWVLDVIPRGRLSMILEYVDPRTPHFWRSTLEAGGDGAVLCVVSIDAPDVEAAQRQAVEGTAAFLSRMAQALLEANEET